MCEKCYVNHREVAVVAIWSIKCYKQAELYWTEYQICRMIWNVCQYVGRLLWRLFGVDFIHFISLFYVWYLRYNLRVLKSKYCHAVCLITFWGVPQVLGDTLCNWCFILDYSLALLSICTWRVRPSGTDPVIHHIRHLFWNWNKCSIYFVLQKYPHILTWKWKYYWESLPYDHKWNLAGTLQWKSWKEKLFF